VKVDQLLVRYDAACAGRSLKELARSEAKILEALLEAERTARGERDGARLAQSIRRVASEFQALERRTDPVSLDRKRSALFGLSEALWTDLAEELDGGTPPGRRGDDRF
jgi:hypothetical protein